ncbi:MULTISPECIES: glycosyltransferase [Xanthomarina]|uniref:glycosyltransferase n=1 Tax=Xanthomarina TaxID=1868329 RepID=UPI002C1D0D09|nr:glycosyltransferase [Xanthomarina sp.]HLT65588.1 glycosyltransferase [Flavobacterium sp.]HLV38628.1 glycosyltransferase [Xanthomarina sp.]
MQSNNKKICIVTSSLGKGGAEQSTALLSKMLEQMGYTIHLVTVLNLVDYEYAGTLLNLGALKDEKDGIFARLNRLLVFRKHLKNHQFYCIIDNRSRNSWLRETLLTKLIYKPYRVIYVLRSYNLNYYFPKNKNLAKSLYQNASGIVCVSKEIETLVKNVYGFKNTTTIYNPIQEPQLPLKSGFVVDYKYVLAYGRLDEAVKNYSLLIESYKLSSLPQENINLIIMGSGPDLNVLKKKVSKLEIENNVHFIPFNKNPLEIVAKAQFVCLTSRFEGFPRVLIESLSLGVPVISVDCLSGPNEIIKHGHNGLLVENFNANAFAEAMNSFIFDDSLYRFCKQNAKESVLPFAMEQIALQWEDLLKNIS